MAGKLHTGVGERRHRHVDNPVVLAATSAVESHRVQDGPARVSFGRPMASDRRVLSRSAPFSSRRTTSGPLAAVPRGNPLGVNFRRPMDRFTRTLSLSVYLLATPPRLVTQRRVPGRLGSPVGKTRSAAAYRLGRGDRRRLVFTGKKGATRLAAATKATARASCC
jgi:hypothetical protein